MKGIIKFTIKELIYNGHLQSFGVVSVVYLSTIIFLPGYLSFESLLFSYLIFESIFLYDRYSGVAYDGKTNIERTQHILLYRNYIPTVIALFVTVACLGILEYANYQTLIFIIVIFLMGIMYAILFKNLTKKIWLFKNYYVAVFYAAMVFYPFLYYRVILPYKAILLLFIIIIFLNSFAGQIVLDVKDLITDRENGLKTMPVTLGIEKTIFISRIISILAAGGLVIGGFVLNFRALVYLGPINLLLFYYFTELILLKQKIGFILAASNFFLWFCFVIAVNIVL